ncbi:MAG TPA: IPT/TIG domain-containing protein [Candidatus Binatia bacterium]|nr:IPT/TIG domain-containing protein [Candidatus Binatia bacterium]
MKRVIACLANGGLAFGLLVAVGVHASHAQQTCYGYDETGQLIAAVSAQGQTIIYDYDAVGNPVNVRRNDATTPVAITFVSPVSAVGGQPITLLGTGFSDDPDQDAVTIGGVPATVTAANSCSLTVTVPPNATAGPGSIHVTTPTGSATYTGSFSLEVGLMVSPSVGEAIINQTIGFVATVTGTTDQRVSWGVNSVVGGDATNGTITPTGLYTAPAAIPAGVAVAIQATSVGFPSVTGQANVTVVAVGNRFAHTAVSVQLGAPPPLSVVALPVGVQFGTLSPGGANALPVSVQFDTAPSPISVVALPVSVQFGPLSSGGANALPVSVGFGALSSTIVQAPPVSVANAAVISNVAPTSGGRGTSFGITLTGTNLTGATGLAFVVNGAPDAHIAATNIVVTMNGTHLTANVTIDGSATLGTHVVVVQTASGQSALGNTGSNTFSVNP